MRDGSVHEKHGSFFFRRSRVSRVYNYYQSSPSLRYATSLPNVENVVYIICINVFDLHSCVRICSRRTIRNESRGGFSHYPRDYPRLTQSHSLSYSNMYLVSRIGKTAASRNSINPKMRIAS